MRGEVPTHLLPFTYLQSETGLSESTESEEGGPAQAARHNAAVREVKSGNELKKVQLAAGMMAVHNSPAQHIIVSLMPKTGLRLRRMKLAHSVAGAPNTYNGKAMWDELVALRATVGLLEETRDHDRAVELMRVTTLADGCSAQAG